MNRLKMLLVMTAVLTLFCVPVAFAQVSEFGAAEPYVVQKGDTAASIAKRFYGKSSLGAKLWQANQNLVAHPNRLTVGDTIFLFPESALVSGKKTAVPPPPVEAPTDLYDRGSLYNIKMPKYFNFVADGRGVGEGGAMRIRIKKIDPVTETEVDELYEVREVGQIIASSEHPGVMFNDGSEKAKYGGKIMLSINDDVTVLFTEDVAKILDSETYGDTDPYFREFPIYSRGESVRGGDRDRVDFARNIGEIYKYKGMLKIVARVEGLAPLSPRDRQRLKRSQGTRNQDTEPVSYVGKITYSVDAINLNDNVFLFVPLQPGPERVLEPTFVEEPDSYVSLGE